MVSFTQSRSGLSSPNSGKSSHGSRITNMRFTSCPLKSFCLYIRNFSAFFTLPEKNFFEKVLCLTQCYRLEGRGFSQFGQKNKTDLSKLTDRFLLSPKGCEVLQCHTFSMNKLFELLSPAGARVVTMNTRRRSVGKAGCCPPQGRELLLHDLGYEIHD